MKHGPLILGIETSCDETAAAVVAGGRRILASVTHSQTSVHHRYGGIVPELAGREHIANIVPVVEESLRRAGVVPSDLDAVGVATNPGLLGALLVGVSFAKALAWGAGVSLVEVNHLEGHILSVFLASRPPRFPFAALVVSGGHTSLYQVEGPTDFTVLGETRDDAAGEAFDKVAKYLGLGYPGGPVIEELAREGDPAAIRFPRAWLSPSSLDFSFSGLKTAVVNHLAARHGLAREDLGPVGPVLSREKLADIAASFQAAVIEVLVGKARLAARRCGCRTVAVVGGVAANGALRHAFLEENSGLKAVFPPRDLCTDNAAMIAVAAFHRLRAGHFGGLATDASARCAPCPLPRR